MCRRRSQERARLPTSRARRWARAAPTDGSAPSGTSECGRYRNTMTALTVARTAPTVTARWMPPTKAWSAAAVSTSCRRRQRRRNAQRAGDRRARRRLVGRTQAAQERERPWSRSATRRCCRARRRRARRRARGWRRSSPSPRRRAGRGTADMIAAVIGDIVSAMPVVKRDHAQHDVHVRRVRAEPAEQDKPDRDAAACRRRPCGARRTAR